MTDYAFTYRQPEHAGRSVFRATNAGRVDHELVIVRLPEDLPLTIDQQLHSPDRRPFPTVVALVARRPGTTGTFALDLGPGRYAMLCLLREPGSDQEHALRGMNSEFRVM
ncbi:MAG TPA: hypothetical protein VM142_12375 [Acidimicrobiales bacterium]|nr:hypothetical protein [Acidimicrobiales bacterium]